MQILNNIGKNLFILYLFIVIKYDIIKGSDQYCATCEKTEKRNKPGRLGETGDPPIPTPDI